MVPECVPMIREMCCYHQKKGKVKADHQRHFVAYIGLLIALRYTIFCFNYTQQFGLKHGH